MADSLDPTKIDIDFDPHHQRMTGTTYHGWHDFNVPYITHVTGNLYVGGTRSGLIMPEFIEHDVSLYPWERYTVEHELVSQLEYRLYDSADQGMDQVFRLASWVMECLKEGPTLVRCQAGLNRSNLIAATALWLDDYDTPEAIVAHLRDVRSPAVLCNPTFEAFVLDLSNLESYR